MKKLFLISLLVLVSSCVCKKNIKEKVHESQLVSEIASDCPKDGKCTALLLKNKSLEVKTDEFGTTYYQLTEASETSVVQYQYQRNPREGIQDSEYAETVLFEIPNANGTLSLSNLDLQQTKMIYGRLCFCRGQTGYYSVSEGKLHLTKKNNLIQFELDFKNNKVPQIVPTIKATIN